MFKFTLYRFIIFYFLFSLLFAINDFIYWGKVEYLLNFFQNFFNPLTIFNYLYNAIVLKDMGLLIAWVQIFLISFLLSFLDFSYVNKLFKRSKVKNHRIKNKRRSR